MVIKPPEVLHRHRFDFLRVTHKFFRIIKVIDSKREGDIAKVLSKLSS